MLELYKVLLPWEHGGIKYHFDSPLSLVEEFDHEDPFFNDTGSVITFCDEYVEDSRNNPFTCMSSYMLFQDGYILKQYKSRSEEHVVKWVYPSDFDLIQINDRCFLNREHHLIQFFDGEWYSYESIQDDRSSYLLYRLGMQDKVIIKL